MTETHLVCARRGISAAWGTPAMRPRENWRSAFCILAFLALSGLWLIWALWVAPKTAVAWDFTQFYIASHLPLKLLYSRPAFVSFGQKWLAAIGINYYPPYVRPAVFALALKPLAHFSYWHAFWLWAAVEFAAYGAALYLLFRWLALPKALLPAFALFFPTQFAVINGQDADLYLLVLLVGLLLVFQGKQRAAGCLFALCVYKFNLLVLLPVVLLLKGRRKALLTFGIGSAAATIVSVALAPPSEYLALLHSIPDYAIAFRPGGLRGALVWMGHEGWYFPLALVGAAACTYLIWRLPLREAFCVAIAGSLLFTYHGCWYDRALLVIPIAVAWRHGGAAIRAVLLVLLLLAPAWILGRELFQVPAEVFLITRFAVILLPPRVAVRVTSVESPESWEAQSTYP